MPQFKKIKIAVTATFKDKIMHSVPKPSWARAPHLCDAKTIRALTVGEKIREFIDNLKLNLVPNTKEILQTAVKISLHECFSVQTYR